MKFVILLNDKHYGCLYVTYNGNVSKDRQEAKTFDSYEKAYQESKRYDDSYVESLPINNFYRTAG